MSQILQNHDVLAVHDVRHSYFACLRVADADGYYNDLNSCRGGH